MFLCFFPVPILISVFIIWYRLLHLYFVICLIEFYIKIFCLSGALRADPTSGLHALWYAKLLSKKGYVSQAEVMYQVAISNSRSLVPSIFAEVRGKNSASVPSVTPLLPVSISVPVNVRKPLGGSSPSTSSSSPLSSSLPSTYSNSFSFSSGTSVEASAICNYAIFLYKQRKDLLKSLSLFENGLKKFETHRGLIKNYLLLLKDNPSLESISHPILPAILQSRKRQRNKRLPNF